MNASLQLHSERFSASGNLVAEGIEKLLGAPSLDLLTVLVREATQNACDATLPGGECRLKWRLRRLSPEELAVFRERVFTTLPEEASARQGIENFLSQSEWQWVLEICDYGTTGLQGPTRADRTEGVDNPDFVNFFRNLGAPRDVEKGGGTYGYGKSTLYRASRCHAIIVDTLTRHEGREERRLMAAQLGRSVQGRFTGRHWWGVPLEDAGGVDPLRGEQAAALAEALGMPPRNAGDTGTSIMILAPVFTNLPGDESGTLQEILEQFPAEKLVTGAIRENLLWFFWPRMLRDSPPGKRLVCETWNGETFERLDQPEGLAPFHLFAQALRLARGDDEAVGGSETVVHDIRSQRPIKFLGRLALARGQKRPRKLFLPPLQPEVLEKIGLPARIPERCHHVALMRPAEMVVKYEKGEPEADPACEWVGVFRVSDEEEVERAFADAEPPAHDDWRPDILAERRQKTFVRVALRRIREKLAPAIAEPAGEEDETHALGKLADELGRFLDLENAPGPIPPGENSPGRGGRHRPFTQPRFVGLMEIDGRAVARFAFKVNSDVSVAVDPRVMVDGKADRPDEIVGRPEILEWTDAGGKRHLYAEKVNLTPGDWEIRIVMPEQAAVKVRLKESE